MKERRILPRLLCILLFAALSAGLYVLSAKGSSRVPLAFAMAFAVMAAETLLVLILSLFHPESHRSRTLLTLVQSLLKYVAAIVILCWGLRLLGVDLSTIVTAVGILALVLGFGAESLISDLVTGTFMLFENQYNVGDIVEVNGFRGTVKEIGVRTTSIIDAGKNVKIINNSDMKNILNRSSNASLAVSDIDVPYETDLPVLEQKLPALLEKIYAAQRDTFLSAPSYLGVQALGSSGVTLRFIAEVPEDKIYSGARLLNRELLLGFKSLGVECPFPQLDLHQR